MNFHSKNDIIRSSNDMNRPYFKHFIIELVTDSNNLNSIKWLKEKTELLLLSLKIKYVKDIFHQFSPSGISLVYILSSSHIAIHTWPENKYLHIDLITCSQNKELENIASIVKATFNNENVNIKELNYYEKQR